MLWKDRVGVGRGVCGSEEEERRGRDRISIDIVVVSTVGLVVESCLYD